MASKELKLTGFILGSYGSNFDTVVDNGVEIKVKPVVDVNNPYRLNYIFTPEGE